MRMLPKGRNGFAVFITLVATLGGIAIGAEGALWGWQRFHAEPKFEGPHAKLRASLYRYEHAETFGLRLGSALEVEQDIQAGEPGWSGDLTAHELEIKKSADLLVEDTRPRILAWEASLTRQEINFITEANPLSVYRGAGVYRSFALECTEEEYAELRSRVDLRELNERAYLVTQWIAQNEKPFEAEYAKRRIELLQDDRYWQKKDETAEAHANRETVAAWFVAGGDRSDSRFLNPESAERYVARTQTIETTGEAPITITQAAAVDYSRQLVSTGLSEGQLLDTVVNYAEAAPDCVIGVHSDFIRRLRAEVTHERGKNLMERLAQWIGETGVIQSRFEDLPLDRSDSLFGNPLDAWGHEYIFAPSGDQLRISSSGGDPLNQKAEIYIGSLQLPESDQNLDQEAE
jgi:hypothetical protein